MAEPRVRVFLSHKAKTDAEELVTELSHELEAISAGALRVFVAGDDIREGSNWRSVIVNELREANLLILLFTEPHLKWDWCLYEVGLYTRLMTVGEQGERSPPIICIYPHGSEPPTPIEHIQGVVAVKKDVVQFLEALYTTGDLFCAADPGSKPPAAIVDSVHPESLERLADLILSLYPPLTASPIHPCHRVVLTIPEDVQLTDPDSLRPARVEATKRTREKIFGTRDQNLTWGDLLDRLPGSNSRWLRELFEVIVLAANETEYDPITSTFLGYKNAIYCPELYRVAVTHEGGEPCPREVVVIFDKLMAPSVVGDEVFNLIRANFRFRDEVFDRFADLQHKVDEDGVDIVFERLRESLGVIAHEAETHGFFKQATSRVAYGDDYDDDLDRLQDQWVELESRLAKHIDNRQVDATQNCLEELAKLNLAFSIRAADRHRKLLKQRAESLSSPSDDRVIGFPRANIGRD